MKKKVALKAASFFSHNYFPIVFKGKFKWLKKKYSEIKTIYSETRLKWTSLVGPACAFTGRLSAQWTRRRPANRESSPDDSTVMPTNTFVINFSSNTVWGQLMSATADECFLLLVLSENVSLLHRLLAYPHLSCYLSIGKMALQHLKLGLTPQIKTSVQHSWLDCGQRDFGKPAIIPANRRKTKQAPLPHPRSPHPVIKRKRRRCVTSVWFSFLRCHLPLTFLQWASVLYTYFNRKITQFTPF